MNGELFPREPVAPRWANDLAVPARSVEVASPIAVATPVRLGRQEAAHCERVITEELESARESAGRIGESLKILRDGRHHLDQGYESFEAYILEKWGFTRGRAYQLILFHEVREGIRAGDPGMHTAVDILPETDPEMSTRVYILPENERQTRPLVNLTPEERCAAWSEAVERSGGVQPSAKVVKAAAAKRRPPKAKAPPKAEPPPAEPTLFEPGPEPEPTPFDVVKEFAAWIRDFGLTEGPAEWGADEWSDFAADLSDVKIGAAAVEHEAWSKAEGTR